MADKAVSILIVDDERPVRTLLDLILTPHFDCDSAESASEALSLIETKSFDLALVDMGLPGLSGLGLCRLIVKRNPETSVVMISGETDDQSIADALAAGAVDYIKKPFDLDHTVHRLQKIIENRLPGAVAS